MNAHLSTDTLIDYIHGELTPSVDAGVHEHIASCAACRMEYDREVTVSEALKGAARAETFELPPMLKARVWEMVRAERPTLWTRLSALLRPAAFVPIAAVLIIGGFLASPMARFGGHRAIAAGYYLDQFAAQQAQRPFGSDHGTASRVLESAYVPGESTTIVAAESAREPFDDIR